MQTLVFLDLDAAPHTNSLQIQGGRYHKKPKWLHTSAFYTETGTGTILSSSIAGSKLY